MKKIIEILKMIKDKDTPPSIKGGILFITLGPLGIILAIIASAIDSNFFLLISFLMLIASILCFIIFCIIENMEKEDREWALKAKLKEYAYFSENGILTLKKRNSEFIEAFSVHDIKYDKYYYAPESYIYTSATVGGITTGGIEKVGGKYYSSGKLYSGKCELMYWETKVKKIQLSPELYNDAQNSKIKKYLDNKKQIIVEDKYDAQSVAIAASLFGTLDTATQSALHGGYPTAEKCYEIIDWICKKS